MGQTADYAHNGLEAYDLVAYRLDNNYPVYKLITMDYSMPEMDGPTATRAIRELVEESGSSDQEQPYICGCSAYAMTAFQVSAKEVGMDCYEIKPIFKKQFQTLLRRASII